MKFLRSVWETRYRPGNESNTNTRNSPARNHTCRDLPPPFLCRFRRNLLKLDEIESSWQWVKHQLKDQSRPPIHKQTNDPSPLSLSSLSFHTRALFRELISLSKHESITKMMKCEQEEHIPHKLWWWWSCTLVHSIHTRIVSRSELVIVFRTVK